MCFVFFVLKLSSFLFELASTSDASPKSPSSGSQVSSSKRTPADKKVNKRNERGEAPLHMAAKKGDYKQTKRLLKAGASVNMKDYAGKCQGIGFCEFYISLTYPSKSNPKAAFSYRSYSSI